MKRIVLVTMMLLLASTAGAATLKETFTRTFNARPGSDFSLSNVNGRVTVTAWDEPRIRVNAEKQVKSGDEENARAAMRELRIEVDQRPGSVAVTTTEPKRRGEFGFFDFLLGTEIQSMVTYDVMVPRQMNVSIDTVNGRVLMKGVSGVLRVDTTNGRVEMERCGGDVDISTTNGSVRAELAGVTAGKGARVETTNGRIVLFVPQAIAADVEASTTNGEIESDLPLVTRSAGRNRLRGALNGGGTPIRLRTTNGGIEIRSTAAVSR